jgi:hypothetical protein
MVGKNVMEIALLSDKSSASYHFTDHFQRQVLARHSRHASHEVVRLEGPKE